MVSLKSTVLFAALALLNPTSASPLLTSRQNTTTYTTTMVTYVANSQCSSSGAIVLPGTVTSGQCLHFQASSYLLTALPDVDCTFTTYALLNCLPANLDTVYELPAGNETVCAYGGVPDGGVHYLRSGIFNCA